MASSATGSAAPQVEVCTLGNLSVNYSMIASKQVAAATRHTASAGQLLSGGDIPPVQHDQRQLGVHRRRGLYQQECAVLGDDDIRQLRQLLGRHLHLIARPGRKQVPVGNSTVSGNTASGEGGAMLVNRERRISTIDGRVRQRRSVPGLHLPEIRAVCLSYAGITVATKHADVNNSVPSYSIVDGDLIYGTAWNLSHQRWRRRHPAKS